MILGIAGSSGSSLARPPRSRRAFIAPAGDPAGPAPMMLLARMYYEMVQHKRPLKRAVELARNVDDDTRMFRLFQ